MENKNKELLTDFKSYCLAHPELRFWQALRNWSGDGYIVAYKQLPDNPEIPYEDTFYREGRTP